MLKTAALWTDNGIGGYLPFVSRHLPWIAMPANIVPGNLYELAIEIALNRSGMSNIVRWQSRNPIERVRKEHG